MATQGLNATFAGICWSSDFPALYAATARSITLLG